MPIVLSIAIPTFNRIESLQKTLASLSSVCQQDEIEILVVDNASSDGTWEWLSTEHEKLGIKIKRNPFNLGVEGNIIHGLINATGKYVWLLSDHMFVYESEVLNFLNKLKNGLNFTLGYARIEAYQAVLSQTYLPLSLEKIDSISLGKLLCFMGNISGFVVNKEYLLSCGRNLFRFSAYSYPHLGVFANLRSDDTIVELNSISQFSSGEKNKSQQVSYHLFRSRWIGFVRALEEIRRLNLKVNWSYRSLKVFNPVLIQDSIYYSCQKDNPIRFSEFIFCVKRYPGSKIRFFLLVCGCLALIPNKPRIRTSHFLFKLLVPNLYSAAVNKPAQVTSEVILE
jgi:glycosyltransferase involved in cell wall biosynthesis